MKTTIEQLADIRAGYQFRERLAMGSDGTHQVIQIKDIQEWNDHRLCPTSLYRFTPKGAAEKYMVRNGDVIFLSRGRRNYATVVEDLPEYGQGTLVASYFFILTFKPGVTDHLRPAYLAWYINQPAAQNYIQSVAGGTMMPFVAKTAFAQLTVEIPPLHVQEAIVNLHRLWLRETTLLQGLENARRRLVQGICMKAAKQSNP